MRRRVVQPSVTWPIGAGLGFLAGILVMSAARSAQSPGSVHEQAAPASTVVTATPTTVMAPPTTVVAPPTIGADPLADLRRRHLMLPVQGLTREALRDGFEELRGGSRRHEALDIAAPRNTPVVAVEDGTVARLFLSDAGGKTVYQFDPTSTYAYYYAHLERYADALQEGDAVERGQIIGYVGTSGNAPPNAPHLHFSIMRLTESRRWWQGTAINPYLIFR